MSKPPSPRPLSIKLLCTYFVLHSIALVWLLEKPYFLLGIEVPLGWAHVVRIMYALLWSLATIGIWRSKELGRQLGIALCAFYIVSTFVGSMITFDQSQSQLQDVGAPIVKTLIVGMFFLTIVNMPNILAIWFLIKRKSAFKPKPMTI